MAKDKQQSNGLDVSDLRGTVKNAIVFPDNHFGLEAAVWNNAQRIANLLPINVQVSGDLYDETVVDLIEKAKGAELEQKNWTEYSAALSRYLKAFKKIKEKQIEVAESTAEALVEHTELESDLGKTLANLESKRRQTIGNYRSAIGVTQNDLEINLNKIASQYSQTIVKRTEREESENKKEETPIAKQTTNLVEKFRKARESRYSGAMAGITQRISAL
ncbi:hypothetical protein LC593_02010 [Nostoc sp. CHAB 5844]|nr:hypothetical protein [Nostoc sp. CHAB 5844]